MAQVRRSALTAACLLGETPRKRAEGKSTRKDLRCLKHHLARSVWQAMRSAAARRQAALTDSYPATLAALVLTS